MEIDEETWKEIVEALKEAEWGYDAYGEYGNGLQNFKVRNILDKFEIVRD